MSIRATGASSTPVQSIQIRDKFNLALFGRGIRITSIEPDEKIGAFTLSGTIVDPTRFDAAQFSDIAQEDRYLVPVDKISMPGGNIISMQVLDLLAFQHSLQELPLEAGF